MCGRYTSTRGPGDLTRLFQVTDWNPAETLAPSWNVAPTDEVYAVLERTARDDGDEALRQLRALRWGLVPSWAKDPKVGSRMINARVETVHEKPAYRRAFAKRRCLLPADGFYEWEPVKDETTGKTRKQPYFIHPADGQVMAMAGLYEYWRNPDIASDDDPDAWLTTCTIITTEATDAAGTPPHAPHPHPEPLRRLARPEPPPHRKPPRPAQPARGRPARRPACLHGRQQRLQQRRPPPRRRHLTRSPPCPVPRTAHRDPPSAILDRSGATAGYR